MARRIQKLFRRISSDSETISWDSENTRGIQKLLVEFRNCFRRIQKLLVVFRNYFRRVQKLFSSDSETIRGIQKLFSSESETTG